MRDFMYQTGLRLLNEEDIIRAQVRYDDCCSNGRQSFAITADIYNKTRYRGEATVTYNGRTYWNFSGGCCHDEVARAFPELAPFIKWHLTFSDGPMHYIANGLYWLREWQKATDLRCQPKNMPRESPEKLLINFKRTVVFGWGSEHEFNDVPDRFLSGLSLKDAEDWLEMRLPYLMTLFMEDMEKVASLKLT